MYNCHDLGDLQISKGQIIPQKQGPWTFKINKISASFLSDFRDKLELLSSDSELSGKQRLQYLSLSTNGFILKQEPFFWVILKLELNVM